MKVEFPGPKKNLPAGWDFFGYFPLLTAAISLFESGNLLRGAK